MPTAIAQKLKIKEGYILLTLNAPAYFQEHLQPLPGNVKISTKASVYNQVHWFVQNKAQMEKEVGKALTMLKDDVTLWIYYPKGSSKMQTDLTRDKGWECLLAHGDKLTWISLISFDETWSVFGCRAKTAADKKKEAQPKTREIFNWADPKTKTIKLPDDLAMALKKNKKEAGYFNTLSFSNKKEYVEWVVTAKREETRTQRIKKTIEKLGKQWKNPRNI